MLPARAIFAGWLFMFFLMRTMAGDLAPDSTNPSVLEPQSAQLRDATPAEPQTAKPAAGSSEGLAAKFSAPTSGGASLQTGPGLKNVVESRKPGFFPDARPNFATLLLFFCLFLLVGIAFTVRKLNNVNRQLNNANRQLNDANSKLERQT